MGCAGYAHSPHSMRIRQHPLLPVQMVIDGERMATGENSYQQPMDAGPWTAPDGVAHIRNAGTGATFCGVLVGAYTGTHPTDACDDCVTVSLAHYAVAHTCTWGCRA